MQVSTVHQVQSMVRGRRKDLGESQESLARRAGVSRKWLSEFERGVTTAAELPLVLRVLAALEVVVDLRPREESGSAPLASELSAGSLDAVLQRFTRPSGRVS
jgi:HTH-type transcriptional regulator / antitoxin HipB